MKLIDTLKKIGQLEKDFCPGGAAVCTEPGSIISMEDLASAVLSAMGQAKEIFEMEDQHAD